MITKEELADLLIERLNEIAKVDPEAMGKLIETRVSCNKALQNHPTVQTCTAAFPCVGMLGIINGLVGVVTDVPEAPMTTGDLLRL